MAQQDESIWSGIYQSFDDITLDDQVFDDNIWVNRQKQKIEQLLTAYIQNSSSTAMAMKDYPLAGIVATSLLYKDLLNIVDFGGSMGQTYLDLLFKIPDAESRLNYTIIETPHICEAGTQMLSAFKNLRFSSDYKLIAKSADIFHIGSTLQYIDDWRGFLTEAVAHITPDIIVLSDMLIGDLPSFATVQRFHARKIKARFINIDEFMDFWNTMPYDLIFKSEFDPLGNGTYFPNTSLPETHRLKLPCHMVFKRK